MRCGFNEDAPFNDRPRSGFDYGSSRPFRSSVMPSCATPRQGEGVSDTDVNILLEIQSYFGRDSVNVKP